MNKKKLLNYLIILCLFATTPPAMAGFQEHYTLGQQFFYNSRYSSAIDEFKKALMINFLDNSARIGLVNSYLARGTYIANGEHNYRLASDDFRSAIFYLKYYVDKDIAMNSLSSIASAYNSLQFCERQYGADMSPAYHYKLAEELDEKGNFTAAMYEYEQVVNNDKYRKTALLRIASMMKSINNLIKASEYYAMAIELEPNNFDARMRYAEVLDRMGNAVGASEQYNYILSNCNNSEEILLDLEKIFSKKLEIAPNNAELLADLGAIKQRQGKYQEAYNYYNQSLSKQSKNEETRLNTQINLGTLLQVQKNYTKAIEVYKNILLLHPSNYQANLYLAQCYELKEGCEKLALEQYKKVQSLKPDSTDYKEKIRQLTRLAMTPDDVYNYIKSVVNPDKSYVDELYEHAIYAHEKKDYPTAIKYYSLVKKVDPEKENVYENLAICYAQIKDYKNANEILNTAKEKFPNNKNIVKTLSDIKNDQTSEILNNAYNAYNTNNYAKAIELYMSVEPKTVDSLLGIASSYQGLNQHDKALEYYLKALEMSPNNSDIAYNVGALYANMQDYVNAKKYFQKSVQLNQNNTNAKEAVLDMSDMICQKYIDSAVKNIDNKKFEEALKDLNSALNENNKNPDAYYYRGTVYDSLHKYQAAINDYKKSLQFNPHQDVTYYLIAVDFDNIANPNLALEYYKKFLNVYHSDDEYLQYVKARINEIETELKK